jgi:hypothetical protein
MIERPTLYGPCKFRSRSDCIRCICNHECTLIIECDSLSIFSLRYMLIKVFEMTVRLGLTAQAKSVKKFQAEIVN